MIRRIAKIFNDYGAFAMNPRFRHLCVTACIGTAVLTQSAHATGDLSPIGCIIQPQDVIEISTPVSGIVAEVLSQRGDEVRAGQIIAQLDTTIDALSLALAQARAADRSGIEARQARLAFLDQQAQRLTDLAARQTVSSVQRDEALSEARVARFELAQAEAQLDLLAMEAEREAALMDQKTLRSPVDGLVVEQLLSPGEFRDGQTHIATIARLNTLKVEAFAPLDYYDAVAVGDTVKIRPEAPVGGSYPARITIVDRVFDAATATFGLEMVLDNSEAMLPAGLRCEVDFTG